MRCRANALASVIDHARRASPAECCGILLGADGEIVEAAPVRNVAGSPTRYALDPGEHIAVRRDARARGLAVFGFYHSHPATAPEPSATDIAEAEYPGHLFLIVSLRTEPPAVRLFEWDGRAFRPVRLEGQGSAGSGRLGPVDPAARGSGPAKRG